MSIEQSLKAIMLNADQMAQIADGAVGRQIVENQVRSANDHSMVVLVLGIIFGVLILGTVIFLIMKRLRN